MCGCSIHQTLLHRCVRPPKLIFLTPLTSRLVFRGVGNFCLTRPWKRSRLPKTRPRKATGCSWQGAFTRPRYTWKSSAPSTLSAQVLVCSRLANFSACVSSSWLSCGKDQSCRAQTPLLRGSWLKAACSQRKASDLAFVLLPAGVGSLAWCPSLIPLHRLSCPRSVSHSLHALSFSFGRGGLEHERQLKYTKWRTYQCSHLLENIKHEFLDAESRVDDHYFLQKVRCTSVRL